MVHWDQKKVRKLLLLKLLALMAIAAVLIGTLDDETVARDGDAGELLLEGADRLDADEISAFALRREPSGKTVLFAVGDTNATMIESELQGSTLKSTDVSDFFSTLAQRFSLCAEPGSPTCRKNFKELGSQWEALAVDGAGRFFLLQETTNSIVVLSPDKQSVLAVLNFDFYPPSVGRSQPKEKKSQKSLGEGLVLLKNGHVLIAKESHPAVIVEFGPAADAPLGYGAATLLEPDAAFDLRAAEGETFMRRTLMPLKVWQRDRESKCDFSELAAGPEGALYVLSQKCGQIYKYGSLDPEIDTIRADAIWNLPHKIKNPEALVLTAPGRFVVGSDTKKNRTNIFFLSEK